jgi:hypothetical protein
MLLAAVLALHLQPVSPDAPNRQPQFAVAGGAVTLAFGSGQSIWIARSTDNGRTFGPPAKVADLPRMLLGRHRGPRVVVSGNTILVSAISSDPAAGGHAAHAAPTPKQATPAVHEGGDLLVWRSTDNGRTWSKPVTVNDKATSAREGLHSMVADPAGGLAAVWLDDRLTDGKRLWGAFSSDGGATWSKNVQLSANTICECCHPSLVALGKGEFAAMWRNKLDGSRDFYVLRLRNGKPEGTATKQGEGTWKLEACPMDGGGIALRNGELVTAWRREKSIYLARQGKPEVKLGNGQDVALAGNAKGEYAVWTNGPAVEALLPGSATPQRIAETGAFPSLIALPDGAVLAAWEDNGSIATRRLE